MPTNLCSHERGCIHSHGALYYHHDRTILLPGCRLVCFKLGQSPLYYAPVCGMILMILVRAFPHLLHIQHIKKQGWSAAITLTSLVFQGHGFFHHWSTTPQLRLSIIPLTSGGIPPACSPGILGKPQLRLNNKHGPSSWQSMGFSPLAPTGLESAPMSAHSKAGRSVLRGWFSLCTYWSCLYKVALILDNNLFFPLIG